MRELAPGESPKDTFWFPDVKESDYFYKPVQWAYEQGIAQGSGGYFLPNSTCNIGEILTFIWRAAGSPEPSIQNPYANMKAGAYYYKAALWATNTPDDHAFIRSVSAQTPGRVAAGPPTRYGGQRRFSLACIQHFQPA